MMLADHGAEVIKVEDTRIGDYARWIAPIGPGEDRSAAGATFLSTNRNKRSVRIDLKSAEGVAVFERLVGQADVIVESFRPGVMDRLGLGYDRLRELRPGVILCSISGYGQDGAYRHRAGHDINYTALTGVLDLGGERGGAPAIPAAQIADVGGGTFPAVTAILIALRHRDRTGDGQHLDVSMAHGALTWLTLEAAIGGLDGPAARGDTTLTGRYVSYRVYRCADGYVSFGALESQFWSAFCRGIDREDLLGCGYDQVGSATHRELELIFSGRTRAQWAAFADEHDCCLEPVLDLTEALGSDLVRERGMLLEPADGDAVRELGPSVRMSALPTDPRRRPAPGYGEHTREVLREAGIAEDEIEAAIATGAIAEWDPEAGPAEAPMP